MDNSGLTQNQEMTDEQKEKVAQLMAQRNRFIKQKQASSYLQSLISKRKVMKGRKAGRSKSLFR